MFSEVQRKLQLLPLSQTMFSSIFYQYLCSRIYETLPEVQRRREEERRKAEYQSYRLNAQLYNKVPSNTQQQEIN